VDGPVAAELVCNSATFAGPKSRTAEVEIANLCATLLGPLPRYYITDSTTAELCKYMVNTFLAAKVAFVNQFYDLAQAWGVNFNELRELWPKPITFFF
jgi:UDP-glucose 6-dehydrogenase